MTELPKPRTTPASETILADGTKITSNTPMAFSPEQPEIKAVIKAEAAKPVVPPPPPPKQHTTRVKSHGTLKFYNTMDAEERKAWMKGGGALQQLREQRKMIEQVRQQITAKFCVERDAVLRALDPAMMLEFFKAWKLPLPEKGWINEEVPYIMMHKTRIHINSFTDEEKETSRNWLRARGYSLSMSNNPFIGQQEQDNGNKE